MKITKSWLNKHDACKDAVIRFCEVYPCGEAALSDVIQRLERADWLLWLLGHTGTPHREMVRLACLCARRALRYVPEGEMRPLRAIEAAERWAGNPTRVNTEAARDAARAAAEAAEAAEAASRAAGAAGATRAAEATWSAEAAWAAEAAEDASRAAEAAWAARAASWAAEAAARAAGVASRAAEAAEHLAMCEMIRREIK